MRRKAAIRHRVIFTDEVSGAKVEFRISVKPGTLTETEAREALRAVVRRTADVVSVLPRVDLGIETVEVQRY